MPLFLSIGGHIGRNIGKKVFYLINLIRKVRSESMDKLENMGEELIVAKQNKPKKGRGGTSNFPSSKVSVETEEDKRLVKKLLSEVMVEYKKPKVHSDEELAERLNDYFRRCSENGQVPTVEEMCMSTGYAQQTIWDWETGRSRGVGEQSAEIIKKAKHFLKTFDAKLVISGKLNFLAYCFRAKNYYGMVDKAEYVLTPNAQQDNNYDPDSIRQRYLIEEGGTNDD